MGNTIEIRIRTVIWTVTVAVLSVAATLIVTSAWSADAAPGDTDATYVPTPGCRAFDLRPAPNQVGPRETPLGAGEVYTQQITGDVGECTGPLAIPTEAVAVAMNVTAVNPTAQTNLRLFPADLAEVPLLSNLNVSAGQAPFPNKVDVTLSPGGAIKIYNFKGNVSLLGDIVGYYTTSSLTEVATRLAALEANDDIQDGAIAANTARVAAVDAAQPFTTVSEPISSVIVGEFATEIRRVTVTAPVAGQVATIATGYMEELTDGEYIQCGVVDSTISAGSLGNRMLWESPTGGDSSPLSASQVFDIAAGETATYYLNCFNASSDSAVLSPRLTAIFTPAPNTRTL
ncbi:MAG: hypothetical protein AAFY28_16460 [Actinomycetota bacterium]